MMNLNRFVNMVASILVRRLVNFGIRKGLGYVRRPGSTARSLGAAGRQAPDARAMAKKARQAAKLTRRSGR